MIYRPRLSGVVEGDGLAASQTSPPKALFSGVGKAHCGTNRGFLGMFTRGLKVPRPASKSESSRPQTSRSLDCSHACSHAGRE